MNAAERQPASERTPERVREFWRRQAEAHAEERLLEGGDGSCPGETRVEFEL